MQGLNYTELEKRGFVDTCCKFGIPADSAERLYKSAWPRIRIPFIKRAPKAPPVKAPTVKAPANTMITPSNIAAEEAATAAARATRASEPGLSAGSKNMKVKQPANQRPLQETQTQKTQTASKETQTQKTQTASKETPLSSAETKKIPRSPSMKAYLDAQRRATMSRSPSMKAYLDAQRRARVTNELPAGASEPTRISPATGAETATVPPASGSAGGGGGGGPEGTPEAVGFARRMFRKAKTPLKKIWGFTKSPKLLFPVGLAGGWWLANKFQGENDESQKVPTLTPTDNLLWNEAGDPWNSLGYDTDVSDIW